MTVYEVKNGNNCVTVEARNIAEAVLNAADELNYYEGIFEVFNCMGEMSLGIYTWEGANLEC